MPGGKDGLPEVRFKRSVAAVAGTAALAGALGTSQIRHETFRDHFREHNFALSGKADFHHLENEL